MQNNMRKATWQRQKYIYKYVCLYVCISSDPDYPATRTTRTTTRRNYNCVPQKPSIILSERGKRRPRAWSRISVQVVDGVLMVAHQRIRIIIIIVIILIEAATESPMIIKYAKSRTQTRFI